MHQTKEKNLINNILLYMKKYYLGFAKFLSYIFFEKVM